jgi:hypothetical protein
MYFSTWSSAHIFRDNQGNYPKLGSQDVGTIAIVSAACLVLGRQKGGDTNNGMS